MEAARTFRDLVVWQKAHQLVILTYHYSKVFPREEIFGLTSQLRRAAISVAANIAEGFVKYSLKDKVRFLNIAQGSLEECKYYYLLASDLGYGNNENLNMLASETSKLLVAYINGIKKRTQGSPDH